MSRELIKRRVLVAGRGGRRTVRLAKLHGLDSMLALLEEHEADIRDGKKGEKPHGGFEAVNGTAEPLIYALRQI